MKILLADDHPIVRAGLKMLLERLHGGHEVIEASDYPEAMQICREHQDLKVILLDLLMPGMDNLDGLKRLHELANDTPIVILSASEEPTKVRECLNNGARGYIPKSSSEEVFHSALQLVLSGGTYLPPTLLNQKPNDEPGTRRGEEAKSTASRRSTGQVPALTRRQIEVLGLLVLGKSNKQIAAVLKISEATVHTHVNVIFKVLDVKNRTEAVHVASQFGLT